MWLRNLFRVPRVDITERAIDNLAGIDDISHTQRAALDDLLETRPRAVSALELAVYVLVSSDHVNLRQDNAYRFSIDDDRCIWKEIIAVLADGDLLVQNQAWGIFRELMISGARITLRDVTQEM